MAALTAQERVHQALAQRHIHSAAEEAEMDRIDLWLENPFLRLLRACAGIIGWRVGPQNPWRVR